MKNQFVIEPPKMPWDGPIEEEILDFVRSMKRQWIGYKTGRWADAKGAQAYISAYETVEKHILHEIKLRDMIKERKNGAA